MHLVRSPLRFLGIFLLAATLVPAGRLAAAVYHVGTLTDLTNRIGAAVAGDQIIVSNGIYTTTGAITVSCAGTAAQPILIAAQNIGGAQIAGMSGFYLQGASYVTLQGFSFTYTNFAAGNLSGLVVDTASTHCRITRNTFQDDPIQYWCFVQGDDTEVDHNLFLNKVAQGEYITLDGNHSALQIAQRLWVHDNDFYNNHYAGGNGGESTRLGLGIWKLISAWAVVENNLYEQANGDAEAISVKSSDDVLRYNTITNSVGYISLRQETRGRAEGNFIFNSGGIKFYADDNLIFNNYLQGATNGIAFGSGTYPDITDSDNNDNTGPHAATHRARVEFNTLVNCPVYMDLNNQGSYNPSDCIVANNILQGNSGYFVSSALTAAETNFTWQTNIFWGSASQSYSPAGGYQAVNPQLPTNTATPFHITASSPAISASYAAPGEVVSDMDGQPRTGTPDIGADEYSTAPVARRPLGTNDVGPYLAATNFALVAMPWIQTVMPGNGTGFTNLLSAFNGFTNLVTLTVSNLPAGTTASFSQTSITNGIGSSVLSVTTSNTTPAGRYTLLITATSANFTNTTVACLTVGNLPANWVDTDIGGPGVPGSADNYLNVFAVKGTGTQISGPGDQFHFACQPMTNDFTIAARVLIQPQTSVSAKSGVMIRESTNANAKFVDVVVTPASINMEARTATGGNAVNLATFTAANSLVGTNSPSWVRLVQSGGTFTGYASSNGVDWVWMGATNVTLASSLAGLAVCANENTNLNTTTFDNVNVVPPPGSNFDLSHWYLQLPTSNNILTGASGSVDSASTAQLVAGFTDAYFYTAADGAMVFWAPDDGAITGGSGHPRSELREELVPGNVNSNWTAYGTHVLTATCVVSNVPSDTEKVCIAQIHEQIGAGIPMVMIMFYNNTVYANYWLDGNDNNSSYAWQYGNIGLGDPINYQIVVTDGILSVAVNGVTNTLDLFNTGTNWQTNTVYFKAGDYNQTTNQCNCSTDGAMVDFYALTHWHAPNITNQPASNAVSAGGSASFSVAASDWIGMTYQWFLNGTNSLAGATNAMLTLTNISGGNLGNYSVVVSDSYGSVTSSAALLTTNAPPAITSQPASLGLATGNTATFTVGIFGNAPLAYQWYFNGTNAIGSDTNFLTLANVQAANAGNYSVVVTNAFGAVTSSIASLTLAVASTNLFLDDRWLDGTRNNTSLPADSAWYASTASSLTAKTNSLIGVPDPASTLTWWTYFTTNAASPLQLSVSDTLRVTLAFTPYGVNASNSISGGVRIGAFCSTNGTRTVTDGANPGGTGYTGCMINLNFGQIFGNGMQFYERTNLTDSGLLSTVNDYTGITSYGGPAAGDPGFSNGIPYTLQLLVHRNTNSFDLTATFSNTNGWSTVLTGSWTDTNYMTSAFDTFIFRPTLQSQTDTNFTFTEFKVELVATSNQPPVAVTYTTNTAKSTALSIPATTILAADYDPDGDAISITAVGSTSTNSGTVTLTNNIIKYTPPANYVGADQISYTLTDYRGASTTGYIQLLVGTVPAFFGLTASPSFVYGTTNLALTGTLRGTNGGTTVYPASGETVSATIGGHTVNGSVTNTTGKFYINYNDASLATEGVSGSPHPITYGYAGNSSLTAANNTSTTLTVTKQTPVLTAPTAAAIAYGQTLAGSTLSGGTATNSANNTAVAGGFAFTTPATAPGTGTASQGVTFTPADTADFNNATTTVSVTVNKQTPALTAPTAAAITYGQTLASSALSGGAATNSANNAVVAGSFAFTAPATAPGTGTASQSVTFTPSDTTDYNPATLTVSVTVNKQTPLISGALAASAITYGQAFSNSTLTGGTATNAAGAAVSGSFTFTTPGGIPNAGTTNAAVTFTPADATDYNNASTTVSVTVARQTPLIASGPAASAISYGQAFTNSILTGGTATNTTGATVPGTFTFTIPGGIPNAGITNAAVTFAPADTNDYNNASTTVSVTVGKPAPLISAVPVASAITYGQAFTNSLLTGGAATNAAGAALPGSFAFTTPGGIPNAGTTNAAVIFTPADTADYTNTTITVSVTVARQTPTLTLPTAAGITYGQTLASATLSGGTATNSVNNAVVTGAFAFTMPSTAPGAGTAAQGITFTPTDTVDYNAVTTTVSVTVARQTPTLTLPTAAGITYGQTLANSALSGGAATNSVNNAVVAGTFAFTTPSTAPGAGTAAQGITFTPTDTTDYNSVATTVSVTVAKQTPTLTVPTAGSISYGQTLASSTLSGGAATNSVNNAAVSGTFAFTTPSTAPGVGTASQGITFTPTDTTDYNTSTTTVSVTVGKQTPLISSLPVASQIASGQTLASSTLSGGVVTNAAGATLTGGFAFTTPATVPGGGTTPQSVTFTPADTTDYNSIVTSVNVTVFVTSTNVLVNAHWLDGTRTNTSLPADAAWYANSAPTLVAAANSLTGLPDPANSLTWWTYFTSNSASPAQLSVSDTLRVTLSFTATGINTSNTASSGLRIGLYNSVNGIRTLADGANPKGTNATGFMVSMNFGQLFAASTTMQFWERTNLTSTNLLTTTGDYASTQISTAGAPAKNSAGFSNGFPYTLTLLVHRNASAADLSATFSTTNGWSAAITGSWTDPIYLTSAFDTFAFRPTMQSQTATNFTFTGFKVELVATNNHPPVAGAYATNLTENQTLAIPAVDVLAADSDPDGDALSLTAVSALSTNSGTVTLTSGSIFYTPPAGYVGADQISYTLTDYRGASSTGYVNVTVAKAAPVFSGLTAGPAITYGASAVTLAGTLGNTNGSPAIYPANGESVSATINGHTVSGTVTNSTGRFAINYNDASLATDGVGGSPYVITYAYAGNGSSLAAATNDTSTALTVNPAALAVTAGNLTKAYGQTKTFAGTEFTAGGLLNSDTVAGVTLTSAGAAAGAALGGYSLVPGAATGSGLTNYTITYYNGTLTVVQAGTSVSLASSKNPDGYKDSVSFTATLPADATGSVVFYSATGPISTNGLSGGSAGSLAITNLARGTNLITAAYPGDANYLGSTNTLNQVVTNHPPAAANVTYYRAKGVSLKITIANLLTNVTDGDGDTITLQSAGTSTNGATVTTNSADIFYLPVTGAGSNSNDSFTYTVSDGFGGSATASVLVNVFSASGSAIAGSPTNGVVNLTFFGLPNAVYVVQTTTNLSSPWWSLNTNTAGTNGLWLFTDPHATNSQQYYRATQP